jgi:hypothetical protein
MRVVDLIPGYIKYIIEEDNYVRYQNMYPQLFEHYYKFWAKRTIHQSVLKKNEIIKKRDIIISAIKKVVPTLVKFNSKIKDIPIALFIGEDNSNGHAFLDDKEFVVWIPVERYSTYEEARVFVTHEIIHAIHYSMNREFYFVTKEEKNKISRMLFTEGIATYLTRELLKLSDKEALWADYLKKRKLNDWMEQCVAKLTEMRQFIRKNFDSSDVNIKIFNTDNPKDIFSNRCGYFAGLKLIDYIVKTHNLKSEELLLVSKTDTEKFAIDWLES